MRRLYLVAALLLTTALGYSVGYRTSPSGDTGAAQRSVVGKQDAVLEGVAGRVRDLLLEPDALARAAGLAGLFQTLGPEAVEAVKEAYATAFLDVGDLELVLLGEWWAGFDPKAAFLWTAEDWRAQHPVVVVAVLRGWARRDPQAALHQAMEVNSAPLRRTYLHAVIAGWDDSGEPDLLDFVRAMGRGEERQRAIQVLARRRVLQRGAEGAFEWAESLPDDDQTFKLNVYRRVASSAAEVDPRAAAAWAERQADGPYGWGLPRRVGTRWVKKDPEATMAWLSTFPPSRNRSDAVQETYRAWLSRDGEGATAWLAQQPLEPWLDEALALYALRLSPTDPQQALEWGARVSNDELRWPTLARVARVWFVNDQDAARAWVEQSDLPELYRKKAFEIPEGMQPRRGAPVQAPHMRTPAADPEDVDE